MNSISPVWRDEDTHAEKIIALDQPEYLPLCVLCVEYSDGTEGMAARFRLNEKEREAIINGADIVITQLTFGGKYAPIDVKVAQPNTRPEGYE